MNFFLVQQKTNLKKLIHNFNFIWKMSKYYFYFLNGRFVYKKSNFPSTANGIEHIFQDKKKLFCTQIFRESAYALNTFQYISKSIFGPIGTITRKIILPMTVTRPVELLPKNRILTLEKDTDYWLTVSRPKNVFGLKNSGHKTKVLLKKKNCQDKLIEISDSGFTKITNAEHFSLIYKSDSLYISKFKNNSKKNTHIHYIFIDTLYSYDKEHNYLLNLCFQELENLGLHSITFDNHYSSSDWTMPSLATMLTGLEVNEHGVTDPGTNFSFVDFEDRINHKTSTLFEISNQNGFFNTVVSANPRLNPAYGYSRGVHQFFFKPYLDQDDLMTLWRKEVSGNLDKNSLFFLGLMDLHHPIFGENHEYNLKELSKLVDIDSRFSLQLEGRDDATMFFRQNYYWIAKTLSNNLSNHIKSILANSKKTRNVFILTSDHSGVPSPKAQVQGHKSTERFHTPLTIFADYNLTRSRKINNYIGANTFAEYFFDSFKNDNFDLNCLTKKLLKVENFSKYVLSEVLYPNQTYRAQFVSDSRVIYLESESIVENRTIDLRNKVVKTFDKSRKEFIKNDSETAKVVNDFVNRLVSKSNYDIIIGE